MEHIAIYPYSESYAPIIRHQKLIHDMKIRSLISPRGWGLTGECVKTLDTEFIVTDNFIEGIQECTAVWFVDDANIPHPPALLKEKMHEALRQNKRILFTRSIKSDKDDIKNLIPDEKEIRIETMHCLSERKSIACYNIDTPVIFVLGLSENTDKFEVQATLREQFIQKGYKVSSVSSRKDSTILGMHELPEFMFDINVSEAEKIQLYNQFVKQVELKDTPDIIIIGIPGGAFPYNKKIHNYFGISLYEISNAVTCDFAVFCLPYLNYSLDMTNFTKISNEVNGKFGFPIDYFHIAARTYDHFFAQPLDQDFSWVSLDESFIDMKIETYKRKDVLNLIHRDEAKKITDEIIRQLSGTSKTQSI